MSKPKVVQLLLTCELSPEDGLSSVTDFIDQVDEAIQNHGLDTHITVEEFDPGDVLGEDQ